MHNPIKHGFMVGEKVTYKTGSGRTLYGVVAGHTDYSVLVQFGAKVQTVSPALLGRNYGRR